MLIDWNAIEAIRPRIVEKLRAVERAYDVEILFAIESGSRAWGFASPDSDFDCRFIYRHKRDWYLSIVEGRDVIEEGIDADNFDVAGWDIRKALRLMGKSNPVLHEWLTSPIVWLEEEGMREAFRAVFEKVCDLEAFRHHHAYMGKASVRRHLGDEKVKLKRYFYILRPFMSIRWMDQYAGMPPMSFDALLADLSLPHDLANEINKLTVLKATQPELGLGPHIAVLDAWIEAEFERAFAHKPARPKGPEHTDARFDILNGFFRQMVGFGG